MFDLGTGMYLGFSLIMASLMVYLPLGTAFVILISQRVIRMVRNRDQRQRLFLQIVYIIAGFLVFVFTVAPTLVLFIATKWLMPS